MKKSDNTFIMAGDIGGTKTVLGLFKRGKRRPLLKTIEKYPSQDASDLGDIIEQFLERHQLSVAGACFGIAGPVINGRCKTTNLAWDVSEVRIKKRFNWDHVRLVNDLTATARSIPLLNSHELYPLNKAKARKGQNMALIAPGTGLGEALIVYNDGEYIPVSSEGGHVDFSPNNEEESSLWRYLKKRYGHVSIERVVSGPGLANIYSWLEGSGRYREPAWLARMLKEMDPAAVIAENAINRRNQMCVKALDMFVSILGAVAGNLALIGMTNGGVYLGGGIPPKILSKLKQGTFMKSFTDKGRFSNILEKIPVRVILNDKAALIGAASCALMTVHED